MVPPVRTSRRRPTPGPGYGQRAFGHTRDRACLIEEEAAAIRDAARRILHGETATRVVDDWNRQGLRTTAGGPWRLNAFSALLAQPRLMGVQDEKGGEASPAILDPATFERLAALRLARGRGPRQAPARYLLTGVLMCWRCGSRLCGMAKNPSERLYICQPAGHGGCSGTSIKADAADDALLDLVITHVDSAAFSASLDERIRWLAAHSDELAGSVSTIADQRVRMSELDDMWASGLVTRTRWSALKARLERHVEHQEARMAPLLDLAAQEALRGQGAVLAAEWPTLTFARRRAVLDLLLEHATVLPAKGQKRLLPGERLRPRWRV